MWLVHWRHCLLRWCAFAFFALQGILLARMLGPELRGAFAAAVLIFVDKPCSTWACWAHGQLFAGYAARGTADAPLRRSAARYGWWAGIISLIICLALDVLLIRAEFRWVLPLACLCAINLLNKYVWLCRLWTTGQRQLSRYNQGRLLAAAAFPIVLCLALLLHIHDIVSICWIFVGSQAIVLPLLDAACSSRGAVRWLCRFLVPCRKGPPPLIAAWLASELLERIDMCLMLAMVSDQADVGI